MKIVKASYLISSPSFDQCPALKAPEYAFIGRSNVGKSSIINALCLQKNLAKTSGTPGKTQLINHFEIISNSVAKGKQDKWYIVDLPGYGFAKVPEAIKKQWQQHLGEFLAERRTLTGLVLLMDVRHPMTTLDQQMLSFADHREMDTLLLLTKSDKLSRNQAAKSRLSVQKDRPRSVVLNFSSLDKTGIKEASEWITHHLEGHA